MRARQENLRTACFAAHVKHIGADAVARAEAFARQNVIAAHDALGATQIDNHIAIFGALDDAMHDLADAVFILVILAIALGIAHFLRDDLLGGLGGDAAIVDGWQLIENLVARLSCRIAALGVLNRNLG